VEQPIDKPIPNVVRVNEIEEVKVAAAPNSEKDDDEGER